MRSLLEDSPMTLAFSWETSPQNSRGNIVSRGTKWERDRKNKQFLANKLPCLRNGTREDHCHNEGLIELVYTLSIGTKIIDHGWPWTTLNGQNALCFRKDASFRAHSTNLNEDRPTLSAAKTYANDSRFWKYKVYADIRGASWRGPEMRVGLSTMAVFGDLCGYFFWNFRDKPRNIIWRYATPCRPVTDCQMNIMT